MRNAVMSSLFEKAKKDRNLMLVTGDLGYGVLTKFWEELPEQFINAGISEQNMISMAAGMAMEGKAVFVYSIGNFPTMRCLEQIRNDVAYHGVNVNIISVGGGFVYGPLGVSHHAIEDIAITRAIPGMSVFSPCDPVEAVAIAEYVYMDKKPSYIRLGKGGEKNIQNKINGFEAGKAIKLKDGSKIVIFATGVILNEAVVVADELNKQGTETGLYSFPTIKPVDRKTIFDVADKADIIVTLEEHTVLGGFGSSVSEVLAEKKTKAVLKIIGVDDKFSDVIGSQQFLKDRHGLSSSKILEKVRAII